MTFDKDLHDLVTKEAEKKGKSVSAFVANCVSRFFTTDQKREKMEALAAKSGMTLIEYEEHLFHYAELTGLKFQKVVFAQTSTETGNEGTKLPQ